MEGRKVVIVGTPRNQGRDFILSALLDAIALSEIPLKPGKVVPEPGDDEGLFDELIAEPQIECGDCNVCDAYEVYEHHGVDMVVRKDMKGKHREHCLCYSCERFKPGTLNNCHKAEVVYENCVELDLVTPVWECPDFLPVPDC